MKLDALDLSATEIARRFRWAKEQGHPAYVWPELTFELWRACLREIERAARAVLRGSPSTELRLPAGATPRSMGIAAFTSGLGPLLGFWCHRGVLLTDPGTRAILDLHLRHGAARTDRLREEIVRATAVLASRQIASTWIKGAHTAFAYFPDPGTRPMADLDLVVESGREEDAARALADAGYDCVGRQARPYRSHWRPPGAPPGLRSLELTHLNNVYSVDLHTSLDRNFFGVHTVRFGDAGPVRTEPATHLGELGALVLAQPHLTAVLAAHASEGLHNLTMLRLVELSLVIGRDLRTEDAWCRLDELLGKLSAQRFVYPAFTLVDRFLPETVPGSFLERLRRSVPPRMARILGAIEPHAAQRLERASMDERFMWGTSLTDHIRRFLHMLWPAPASRSLSELSRIYAERLYRLSRGRVSLKARKRPS